MELVGGFGEVDQFSADAVQFYEQALQDAKRRGVNVRALIIVNPHNPLGKCEDSQTLGTSSKLSSFRSLLYTRRVDCIAEVLRQA